MRRRTLLLLISTLAVSIGGCRSVSWRAPSSLAYVESSASGLCAAAELQYLAGARAEEAGDPICVDHYFAAAAETWPLHLSNASCADEPCSQLYRAAVQRLIASAMRFDRLDPERGLWLTSGQVVPTKYYGFVWPPSDFCRFEPVGEYASKTISRRYKTRGIGVEYVVLAGQQRQRSFVKDGQPFAATLVVKPDGGSRGGEYCLELYDPLRCSTTDHGIPLARDLTAPIAYSEATDGDSWLEGFIQPARNEALDGLHMMEPYQPGKIPVIFVHGLLSDPRTWSQLVNDLRAQPEFVTRFQVWTFRYATGDPFLYSAAALRRQLATIRQCYDPLRVDSACSHGVLVGHSLGGLIAKLQVTYSGDELWMAGANRPLESIRTDEETRARLRAAFYFSPVPDIDRVIYIATPHRGSIYAQRWIGRIGSALVEEPPQRVARHAQLIRDNPGAFSTEISRRVPTSIDLLEPESCILQTTNRLPYQRGMRLHSIIGADRCDNAEGPSDGVVAVSSARLFGVQSEIVVAAAHTDIQRKWETFCEVNRILNEQAAELDSRVHDSSIPTATHVNARKHINAGPFADGYRRR